MVNVPLWEGQAVRSPGADSWEESLHSLCARIGTMDRARVVAQTSKSAVSRVSKPAGRLRVPASLLSGAQPTWKSALQQVWKPALQQCGSWRAGTCSQGQILGLLRESPMLQARYA